MGGWMVCNQQWNWHKWCKITVRIIVVGDGGTIERCSNASLTVRGSVAE